MTRSLRTYCFLALIFFSVAGFASEEESLQFVENKGQFSSNVLFRAQLNNGYVFLEKNSITFKIFDPKEYYEAHKHLHKKSGVEVNTIHGQAFTYHFENSSTIVKVGGISPFFEKFNYFLGKDPSKWASDVMLFREIIYHNLYPGIDLKVYSKYGQIKYEWLVSPGANPQDIRIRFEGLNSVSVKNSTLVLKTQMGNLFDKDLKCWQESEYSESSEPDWVSCKYVLKGETIQYQFPEGYKVDLMLIIDPILIFSTYSGSRGDNFGYTATYDVRGNLYAGGITDNTHGEYPVTKGAFQTVCKGGKGYDPVNLPCDISISKYDSSGRKLIYATYVGGSDDEYPHSMVVNGDTELVVFGTTYSNDFPVKSNGFDTTHNSFSSSNPTTDLIVFKLSINGNKMTGGTYFGGNKNDGLTDRAIKFNYADDFRGEVLTDKANNIYVVTSTHSSNIPLKNESKSGLEGPADGLCLKFTPGLDQLLWSTYFGGDGSDGIYSLEFDKNENIYIAGGTFSNNLKTHANAINKKANGDVDGFMAYFDKTTFALQKATYYGTSSYDQIYFLEIDKQGNVYATGQTKGNLKASTGVYSNKAGTGQFILIADANLSQIKKQTVFGARVGNPEISPSAFLVDSCGNIYLSGWGSAILRNGTTANLPITANALQKTTDNNDFYLAVFGKNLSRLLFATYFGGNKTEDHVDGGTSRFDKRGVIYQSVCSSCPDDQGATISDFPTTDSSVFPKNVSWRCSNAAFKIDFQISNKVKAEFIPDQAVCGPAEIQFTNLSTGNGTYFWDFGDTDTSYITHPLHNFPTPGTYKVQLVAIDSNTCNISDTFINTLEVLQKPTADFKVENVACTAKITFSNNSKKYTHADWDLGNGTQSNDPELGEYEYPVPGVYIIRLITDKNMACSDTAYDTVFIRSHTFVQAYFDPDSAFCAPGMVAFRNNSSDPAMYSWDFGNGQTSVLKNPLVTFDQPGTYKVQLVVSDSTTCNVQDTFFRNIEVIQQSKASFEFELNECSSKLRITNTSKNYQTSSWDFGDNTKDSRPQPEYHDYKEKGTYGLMLITDSASLCPDTAFVPVTIKGTPEDEIVPVNVFTPGIDGLNDCFRFGGILNHCSEIKITIYNRWGQKMFETGDFMACWNGRVENTGKECPEGVYFYICEYKGAAKNMEPLFSGTITLIRRGE
ncbi:MAG: gliding motility-associated C-terminal domain-containing protein [Flavobacteriales bacterium]|nr:gliding motility-associated C-terminal domain-containing protein [Flavobacteriales bacterium]